jgi:hypothetical protein
MPGVVCTVVPASGSRGGLLTPRLKSELGVGLTRLTDIHHQEFVTGRMPDCYH